MKMEYTKEDLNWLMKKIDKCSNRYMEAETLLLEIAGMKWYQRIFCVGKILNFIKSRRKYGF